MINGTYRMMPPRLVFLENSARPWLTQLFCSQGLCEIDAFLLADRLTVMTRHVHDENEALRNRCDALIDDFSPFMLGEDKYIETLMREVYTRLDSSHRQLLARLFAKSPDPVLLAPKEKSHISQKADTNQTFRFYARLATGLGGVALVITGLAGLSAKLHDAVFHDAAAKALDPLSNEGASLNCLALAGVVLAAGIVGLCLTKPGQKHRHIVDHDDRLIETCRQDLAAFAANPEKFDWSKTRTRQCTCG